MDWLANMENLGKKKWYIDSLTKEGKFILKEIKDHIHHIFNWLQNSLKVNLIFDYFFNK